MRYHYNKILKIDKKDSLMWNKIMSYNHDCRFSLYAKYQISKII